MNTTRTKTHLPYTWRIGLTVDSARYRAAVEYEIERLRQTRNAAERIARLQSILGRDPAATDHFEITRLPVKGSPDLYVNQWKADRPTHVLVYANGFESHAGWFSEMAGELARAGIAVYAVDRRGSGLNARSMGTSRHWIDDLTAVVENARDAHHDAKVHLASLCFGAAVATAFTVRNPHAVESLIYLSPGLRLRVHPTAREKFQIGLSRLPGCKCNVPSPVRSDDMFTDFAGRLHFLYSDKLRTVAPRADDFFEAGRIRRYALHRLSMVEQPAVVFLAGKDRVVDNAATRKAFAHMPAAPQIVEYPDSEHIIFFNAAKDRLVADIIAFLA